MDDRDTTTDGDGTTVDGDAGTDYGDAGTDHGDAGTDYGDGSTPDGDDTWFGLPAGLRPLVQAGFVLGLGLGGAFDGIVFHQLLQWHQLFTAHPDPAVAADGDLNTLADGAFHLLTWLLIVVGVALLWRAWRRPAVPPSGRALLGSVLLGWGAFNVVEGTVNHFVLEIHHVWPEGPGGRLLWDVAFLLWGVVFLLVGYLVLRSDGNAPSGDA